MMIFGAATATSFSSQTMASERIEGTKTLERIAAALNIPITSLYADLQPEQIGAAGECIRLWYKLRTDAGRDAALSALREILDAEAM